MTRALSSRVVFSQHADFKDISPCERLYVHFLSDCSSNPEYESLAEFREKFSRQLAQTIIQRFSRDEGLRPIGTNVSHGRNTVSIEPRALVGLSAEGRELLRAAAADANGTVIRVVTMGGLSVETNNRNFVERGNARSEARWRRVVEDLVERNLLEQRDLKGEVFSVTDEGYRAADSLGGSTG